MLAWPRADVEFIVDAVEDGIKTIPLRMKHIDEKRGLHGNLPSLHHLRYDEFICFLTSAV